MSYLAAIYTKSNLQTAVDALKNRLDTLPVSRTGYLYAGIGFSVETQGRNINDVSVFTFMYGDGLSVADARQSIALIPNSYEVFENNAWQPLTGSKDNHRFQFWDYTSGAAGDSLDVYFGIAEIEYILHFYDSVMLSGIELTTGNGAFEYNRMSSLIMEGKAENNQESEHILRAATGSKCPPICGGRP